MAAPSSTVADAAVATGLSPTKNSEGFLIHIQQFAARTAVVLQKMPAEALPVVGSLCETFLAFEQLVDTARSNKGALSVLRELFEVVIKGVLDKRSGRSGLPKEGFEKLKEHVGRAEQVAKLCNGVGIKGSVKCFVLARKISDGIAAVRSHVLAFCSANNLALADDTHAQVGKLASDLLGQLEAIKQLTVAQADYEAMDKEVASMTSKLEVMGKEFKAKHNLEAELRRSKEALAAMETQLEEQRRVVDLARRVKVPAAAPRIRDWYVERKAIVSHACDRLGIGSSSADTLSGEPQMVGLAGPSGAGKSTVASMVVRRDDVRASFHKGVLWLQVGQGANDRLAELKHRLAEMVYETVMLKACRPPRKAGIDTDPEDGAAYIREVVDDGSRRFLVVADDVWEAKVLEALRKASVWVLYTTRDGNLIPEAPPICLDQVLQKEAELVLRRAVELDDDAPLPAAAYELMTQCEYGVMYLAFVGRWSDVRGRSDGEAWWAVLSRIVKAQQGREGGQLLSWRAAVLRAGLAEIATENIKNKELYLSLAVMPKGLAFPSEVAAVLLYGHGFSAGDLEAAEGVTAILERWSIVTLEDGGWYRVHDEHADFVQGALAANEDICSRALPRWRGYISSVQALHTFSSDWLVKIWELSAHFAGDDVPSQPFDAALEAMDPLSTDRSTTLRTAAYFHMRRKRWSETFIKFSQLLVVQENLPDGKGCLDVALTLYGLGVCASRAGRMEEAERFYRRALTIQEDKLGVDNPDVATTLDRLGECVSHVGRMEEAERFYRRAVTIREEKLGVDHPDVALTLQGLGACASEAGRTEEAERYYRRALAIREKLGVDDPNVAFTLNNLGSCELKTGRTEEAERYYRRALIILEEKLGVDHSDVALTLNNLGSCVLTTGRTEEAEMFYRRVLTIQEEKLEVDHPDVALTLNNLGVCASKTGRTEEAEKFFRRALTIREKKLRVDHPDVANTLHGLGVCASKAGRTEEAERFYRRALTIREKLGVDHPHVAVTLNNLGVCASKAGRTEEAERFYRRVLTIREKNLGVDHPDVASTLEKLGVVDAM
eukprot:g11147.t1